ncbi:hypothetical protein MTO96_030111 [Rhipicephalus appendiculatus]
MASRPAALPLKEHCFNFTVPDGTASVDEIIDGLEDVMGSEGVLFLQHLGASKFLVAARSASQATKLMSMRALQQGRSRFDDLHHTLLSTMWHLRPYL